MKLFGQTLNSKCKNDDRFRIFKLMEGKDIRFELKYESLMELRGRIDPAYDDADMLFEDFFLWLPFMARNKNWQNGFLEEFASPA